MRRTAIVYDPFNLRHTLDGHPENYRRLQSTMSLLREDGILDRLITVPSTTAPYEAIVAVHRPQYLERLERVAAAGGGNLDADTYINSDSYEAALRSAGGLLNLVDAVMWKQAQNGFALVRPPGHHALAHNGMGFCIFANVAIAARWAQRQHGVQRVLIIDFDVHHGNGTEEMFNSDARILMCSIYQDAIFPNVYAQNAGSNMVNIGVPANTGGETLRDIVETRWMPQLEDFQPEFIFVSAGFDGHRDDMLGGLNMHESDYAWITERLVKLADRTAGGRIVSFLEGGYDLSALGRSVAVHIKALAKL